MNILQAVADAREDAASQQLAADENWLRARAGVDRTARLQAWRRWLRKTLEASLQWPENKPAKDRLIGQCMAEITRIAVQLRGRGWLLDGKALAEHVRALLEPIAKAQAAGSISDFWPYFRASVRCYVEAHAEQIQAEARGTGADEGITTMSDALAALGFGKPQARAESLTELLTAQPSSSLRRKRNVGPQQPSLFPTD